MSNTQKTVHMIGNAHIDPVWRWRFGDGLAEIKATFRSALDRIAQYDDFIFTSAGAFYYQWVEENCPEMFAEIRQAVANGKWNIVGGMWIQPDCNMPSSESFARHFLYSQNYFFEKFGVIAKTGYNVDSFGHAAGLPSLLRQARIENYVFMRPFPEEMDYPPSSAFRWQYGDDEVLAFRLAGYCTNYEEIQGAAQKHEQIADQSPTDIMMFYGVGNHGGGPTIRQIEYLNQFRKQAKHNYIYSDPDAFFDSLRASGQADDLPIVRRGLQNHAPGCYAANAEVKRLHRKSENILAEAEILSNLAQSVENYHVDHPALKNAWKNLLFSQFHDILCGCSVEAAYEDAKAFLNGSASEGLKGAYSAAQRISWSIDTSKGVTANAKEQGRILWEQDNLGTPVVVFNPLDHPVQVPVSILSYDICQAVTDENDTPIPFQHTKTAYTKSFGNNQNTTFLAEIPPLGWRTYWHYSKKTFPTPQTPSPMIAQAHRLCNDRIDVRWDPESGAVTSIRTCDGKDLLGAFASRAIVIDDSENDTWGHGKYVFDQKIGEFGRPEFTVLEQGPCQVSLRVCLHYSRSTLEQVYTLYAGDDRIHVAARIVLNDPLISVKLCFDSGMPQAKWLREVPGGVSSAPQDGREQPMLRYMLTQDQERSFAIVNDSKYSCCAIDGEMRMVIARSCYYCDSSGTRHDGMRLQDIGQHAFRYVIVPNAKKIERVVHTAQELNTEWVVIPETYHRGNLPQKYCHWQCTAPNVSVLAWKQAEDGNGRILRVQETTGQQTSCTAVIGETSVSLTLSPYQIRSFRITPEKITPCDFLEWDI